MKNILILFSICIMASASSYGQIRVQEEAGITSMVSQYISQNRQNSTIKAWKIQIVTTPDRRKMEQAISKFSNLFPQMETEWTHENPYYKVKVGAFETKDELQAFLAEIKREFQSAIPVQDDIEKSALIR